MPKHLGIESSVVNQLFWFAVWSSNTPLLHKESFIHIEPLQKGVRAEVHLDQVDSKSEAIKEFTKLIKKIDLK